VNSYQQPQRRPFPPAAAVVAPPRDREPIANEYENVLTTREVARRLGASPRSVITWVQQGVLPSIRTPGGHHRIPESALDGLMVVRNEATGERVL
jgi:excisionase family DNA binding protein